MNRVRHLRPPAPAVLVHSLAQAEAALRPGHDVVLLSAPGAALYAGCLWWRALVDAARAAHPHTRCTDILDCADAPGLAMAALRLGQRHLVLWPTCPAHKAVSDAAAELGCEVLSAPPPALDLSNRGATRRLAAHLAGESDA